MKTTIILTAQELAGIRAGKIKKIAVRVKEQPSWNKLFGEPKIHLHQKETQFQSAAGVHVLPYAIGARIGVREGWCKLDRSHYINRQYVYKSEIDGDSERIRQEYIKCGYPYQWRSPVTMPSSAIRTWLIPVGCEVKRVRDLSEEDAHNMNIRAITKDGTTFKYGLCGSDGFPYDGGWDWCDFKPTLPEAMQQYITAKFAQQAWDDNHYIFIYTIEKEGV